jgi:hypothetical protein
VSKARRAVAAIALVIATSLPLGAVADADHIRAIAELAVTHSENAKAGYVIAVKMRTSDGRPLNEARVDFYEVVDLFGKREMLVATARTDGQGVGSTTYLPARTGAHDIVMRFAGRDHIPALEVRHTLDATIAAEPYRAAIPPLASFSARVPYGVGVVVLAVWALIAFAFFGSALGIRRGARPAAKDMKDMKEGLIA